MVLYAVAYSYLSFLYTSLNTCKEVRAIYTCFCNIVRVIYTNPIIHKNILLLTLLICQNKFVCLLKH